MEGLKIEKNGITLSMPWDGKALHLTCPLEDTMELIGAGIGECNAWRLMELLTLAKEHYAELKEIYTEKKKVAIVLDFSTKDELNEFCEALNKK